MIRCFIKNKALYSAVILAAIFCVNACGNAKILAGDAIKHAQILGDKAGQIGATDNMLLSYRLHYHAAQEAMQKKRYKVALQEAQTAGDEAGAIIDKREQLTADARKRLDALWNVANHDPFPRRTFIETCFNAERFIENKEFEKAIEIISIAETALRFELNLSKRSTIIIQSEEEYYKQYKFIPVYEKVGENGLEGEVVGTLYKPAEATFIESKWVAPNKRYVKISVTIAPETSTISGWVEGRFVF